VSKATAAAAAAAFIKVEDEEAAAAFSSNMVDFPASLLKTIIVIPNHIITTEQPSSISNFDPNQLPQYTCQDIKSPGRRLYHQELPQPQLQPQPQHHYIDPLLLMNTAAVDTISWGGMSQDAFPPSPTTTMSNNSMSTSNSSLSLSSDMASISATPGCELLAQDVMWSDSFDLALDELGLDASDEVLEISPHLWQENWLS
jgi:hypothetical protein